MTDVFVTADNIFSPLGPDSAGNFARVLKMDSGIKKQERSGLSEQPFFAALFDENQPIGTLASAGTYTRFEQLMIASVTDALKLYPGLPSDPKTALIISSTKGNISLLETGTESPDLRERISLQHSAKVLAGHFGFVNPPVVVSNACISGSLALITGMRMIRSGRYENVIVTGADLISKFVLSGFRSFQAISATRCRPFDKSRDGINLGEGAATIILSSRKNAASGIKLSGGSVSNDANHISGPSRTGEELYLAIRKAMADANLSVNDIDMVSAHGTATIFNDEMEAKAITLAGMESIPVNSLKGYYGHTLGAAGLIESVISMHAMREDLVIPTLGFQQLGVSKPVNVCSTLYKTSVRNFVKTASGFGGCNAALVFSCS